MLQSLTDVNYEVLKTIVTSTVSLTILITIALVLFRWIHNPQSVSQSAGHFNLLRNVLSVFRAFVHLLLPTLH